jgi:predicted transcriptional regulator of viral defense system
MHDTASRPDASELNRLAFSQNGYFTVEQASECGFNANLLNYHARHGRFMHFRRGLYRLSDYPSSSHEEVWAKWLAAGKGQAVVSHESALELHELSDVMPNVVHLLVARKDRGRRAIPGVVFHTTTIPLAKSEVVWREGIRVTSPSRSIVDAALWGTAPEQIEMAIRQALTQGLTTPDALLDQAQRAGRRISEQISTVVTETVLP